MRQFLALVLAGILVAPPLYSAGEGDMEIIDAGDGQFRIDVPVVVPAETTEARRVLEQGEEDFVEGVGAGIGYLAVSLDTVPEELFLDGKKMFLQRPSIVLPVQQGRHYLSFFEVKDVYITYRDETPERFWQLIAPGGLPADRFSLLSSFEREAVRVGTKWVQVDAFDTVKVTLSQKEVAQTYQRHAATAAITFFSVTAVIAAAMFGSVALLARD
ncbi:MAG: hypothetical protein ABIK23_02435 [candidate division WOR-3 bacterium]